MVSGGAWPVRLRRSGRGVGFSADDLDASYPGLAPFSAAPGGAEVQFVLSGVPADGRGHAYLLYASAGGEWRPVRFDVRPDGRLARVVDDPRVAGVFGDGGSDPRIGVMGGGFIALTDLTAPAGRRDPGVFVSDSDVGDSRAGEDGYDGRSSVRSRTAQGARRVVGDSPEARERSRAGLADPQAPSLPDKPSRADDLRMRRESESERSSAYGNTAEAKASKERDRRHGESVERMQKRLLPGMDDDDDPGSLRSRVTAKPGMEDLEADAGRRANDRMRRIGGYSAPGSGRQSTTGRVPGASSNGIRTPQPRVPVNPMAPRGSSRGAFGFR